MLITKRCKEKCVRIRIGKTQNPEKPAMEYLGVIIETKLNFKQHLQYVSNTADVNMALIRVGGLTVQIDRGRGGKKGEYNR